MARDNMKTNIKENLFSGNKIGFHYFQDTDHYTNKDLNTWLPELIKLKASWLVIQSDSSRAIPEQFIHGLLQANITPIIQFPLRLPDAPSSADLHAIFEAYSHWGVKFVVLFNKPNQITSWSSASWSQQDLVERFVDRFLPLALEVSKVGLTPVFPPLEPGGDYWDTSFLRSSLGSIKRRGSFDLLNNMIISVMSYTFGHDLDWGNGGPEKWTAVKPYFTPSGSEDQCGFNNCQWVESYAKAIGLTNVSLFQFGCGVKTRTDVYSPVMHAEVVQEIINRIEDPKYASVKASNFWLLTAEPGTEEYQQSWFKAGGKALPVVRVLTSDPNGSEKKTSRYGIENENQSEQEFSHPIAHYLLLPVSEWGAADWYLKVARPYILKHRPTIGFSLEEASLAKKVTVVGNEQEFSQDAITHLRSLGCEVDQISGDGTSIATLLAER